MACPYFFPLRILEPGEWDPAPRMPLGATFSGECRLKASVQPEPGDSQPTKQLDLCNSGYARGLCPRFPANAPADAVRFSLLISVDEIIYILEKDHAPLEHGRLGLDRLDGDTTLLAQARAFVGAHRKS